MNILPHKSWHVRTKKNIARVRKDEAEAAEKEKEKQRRIALADQEAKLDILRKKANFNKPIEHTDVYNSSEHPVTDEIASRLSTNSHVNFFTDLEDGKNVSTKKNTENMQEKKEEQEKYEKQIGYLTYLGQDTNESLKTRSWYETVPDREVQNFQKSVEIGLKTKEYNDPLNVMRKYLQGNKPCVKTEVVTTQPIVSTTKICSFPKSINKKTKKHKKEKKSKHKKRSKKRHLSSESETEEYQVAKKVKLELLRSERLKREMAERERSDALIDKLYKGNVPEKEKVVLDQKINPPTKFIKQKYNSQFNPELAKQNYS